MSLTTYVELKIVKERFLKEFPKPEFRVKAPLLAPPLTAQYGLVGTAFDYLLRFYIEKLNPSAHADGWVAEEALEDLKVDNHPQFKKANASFNEATKLYKKFLNSRDQRPTRELVAASVALAHLDQVYRIGKLDPSAFGPVPTAVLTDLEAMLLLVKPELFLAKQRFVLNPCFSDFASGIVGGADADLVIDDKLIDIKTNKDLAFGRDIFNQLVGYYLLWRMGGIKHCSKDPINCLGVYFARYGILHFVPVGAFIAEDRVPELVEWFKMCTFQH